MNNKLNKTDGNSLLLNPGKSISDSTHAAPSAQSISSSMRLQPPQRETQRLGQRAGPPGTSDMVMGERHKNQQLAFLEQPPMSQQQLERQERRGEVSAPEQHSVAATSAECRTVPALSTSSMPLCQTACTADPSSPRRIPPPLAHRFSLAALPPGIYTTTELEMLLLQQRQPAAGGQASSGPVDRGGAGVGSRAESGSMTLEQQQHPHQNLRNTSSAAPEVEEQDRLTTTQPGAAVTQGNENSLLTELLLRKHERNRQLAVAAPGTAATQSNHPAVTFLASSCSSTWLQQQQQQQSSAPASLQRKLRQLQEDEDDRENSAIEELLRQRFHHQQQQQRHQHPSTTMFLASGAPPSSLSSLSAAMPLPRQQEEEDLSILLRQQTAAALDCRQLLHGAATFPLLARERPAGAGSTFSSGVAAAHHPAIHIFISPSSTRPAAPAGVAYSEQHRRGLWQPHTFTTTLGGARQQQWLPQDDSNAALFFSQHPYSFSSAPSRKSIAEREGRSIGTAAAGAAAAASSGGADQLPGRGALMDQLRMTGAHGVGIGAAERESASFAALGGPCAGAADDSYLLHRPSLLEFQQQQQHLIRKDSKLRESAFATALPSLQSSTAAAGATHTHLISRQEQGFPKLFSSAGSYPPASNGFAVAAPVGCAHNIGGGSLCGGGGVQESMNPRKRAAAASPSVISNKQCTAVCVNQQCQLPIDLSTTSDSNNKRYRNMTNWRKSQSTRYSRPKRPLSAYNIFFQEERQKLVAQVQEQQQLTGGSRRMTLNTGLSFEELARTIAPKWKTIAPEEKKRYQEIAKIDSERYQQEMQEYHEQIATQRLQENENESGEI